MNPFFNLYTIKNYFLTAFLLAAMIILIGCGQTEDTQPQEDTPIVVDKNQLQ